MIELIVLDVDGTLTDGKIIYDSNGVETKHFDVKDGFAIYAWLKLNKKVAIISGRNSLVTENRAKELRIPHIYQGIKNKLQKVQEICKQENLTLNQVAAIGDDINDLAMLKAVGLSFTPKDGVNALKSCVTQVLSKKGGMGAVREMIEILIDRENLREQFYAIY